MSPITDRTQVTAMIVSAKVAKGIKWADVATKIGLSKEWTTAGCLGQMTFTKAQAEIVGDLLRPERRGRGLAAGGAVQGSRCRPRCRPTR